MAKHRKVNPQKWNDPRVRALSKPEANGQSLYWFLRTGPQTGIVPGLYEARAGGLADYLGWERQDFDHSFAELEAEKLAEADWDAGVVWVPDAIEDDNPQSTNAAIAWGNALAELPACSLKDKAYQHVLALLQGIREGLAQAFEKAYLTQIPDTRYQITDPRHQTQRGGDAAVSGEGKPAARKGKQPRKRAPDPKRLAAARKEALRKSRTGKRGKPRVSESEPNPDLFRPDLANDHLETLDGRHGRGRQLKLGKQVSDEVLRIYKGMRERATGNGYVKVGAKGILAAREIGVACMGYGTTPERLVEYWQDPANNFTNMAFPSLGFLGNEKNLDRAASALSTVKGKRRTRPRAAGQGHSYDDESELDPRLRSALIDIGFEVGDMTDRQLLTVQGAAKALAAGGSPGMSKDLRAMASRVKTLFQGGD